MPGDDAAHDVARAGRGRAHGREAGDLPEGGSEEAEGIGLPRLHAGGAHAGDLPGGGQIDGGAVDPQNVQSVGGQVDKTGGHVNAPNETPVRGLHSPILTGGYVRAQGIMRTNASVFFGTPLNRQPVSTS